MNLRELGWTADRQAVWSEDDAMGRPARVCAQWRGAYDVWTESGERRAILAGALRHSGASPPVVGDWVVVDLGGDGPARILEVLPRRTVLRRRAAGRRTEAQLVAANLDTVFVVTAFDGDVSLRRLDRYITAVWDSGAIPVVVLNKSDLEEDVETVRLRIEDRSPGVSAHAVSAATGDGLSELEAYLRPGRTVAMIGSSGVGKTTLLARLAGLDLLTQRLGIDGRGQHTTTNRQMHRLPGDALLIDTPGMRELGLWDADEGLDAAFADIDVLAEGCRFRDCEHEGEPGCAIRAALDSGALEADRLGSYHKLQRELRHDAARYADGLALSQARKERRAFARSCRARMKAKGR